MVVARELDTAIAFALDSAPFIVYEGNPSDMGVRAISPNVERLLGYRPDEIVGVAGWWAEHVHPEDLPAASAAFEEALASRKDEVCVGFRVRHRDGTDRWWETITTFEYDERGVPVASRGYAIDVTERHRAVESKLEAQERYRGIVENAVEGIFRTSVDGTVLFVNPALARMAGFDSPEDFMTAIPNIAATYGDPEAREGLLRRLQQEGEVVGFEIRGSPLVGEDRWATLNARLVRDAEGRPVGVEGTLEDVTGHRRAEEALRESEERFRRLADATVEGVGVHADGVMVEANRALASMFGYEVDELLGLSPLDLVAPESMQAAKEQLRSGAEAPLELVVLRRDGSTFVAEIAARTIAYGETFARVVAVRDVTKRKAAEEALREAEARYRTLVEQIPAVTYVSASDRRHPEKAALLYVSPQVESMLGYRQGKWLSAADSWTRSLHEEDRDRVMAEDARCVETGERFVVEYRVRGPDDRIVWVHDEAELLGDPVSDLQLWHGVMLDVTAQRLAEEELRESMAMLRQVTEERRRLLKRLTEVQEDERRRLAADIHDDPIQKMTAAGLRAESLRRELTDPRQLETLDNLQRTIAVAISRLRRLLFELRPSSLDREGLASALRQFARELADDDLIVEVEDRLVVEPPDEVRVVAYRIAQEALSNVRKHAGVSRADLLLENRGEDLYLRIRDGGAGFDPSTVGDRRPGHLGLSTMRERAELAGGSFRLQSAVGSGTTVEVRLPVRAARAVASAG